MINSLRKRKFTAVILVYVIYVSLGIPDSLLGVAWPAVQLDLGVPIYYASIVFAIVTVLAALSSISYLHITKLMKVGNIVILSCLITAIGLLIMGLSNSFIMLCIASIPLGVGAGSVDAALNNFVSENLSLKHMIWLHGSWGIGAIIGPSVYSVLANNNSPWQYSAMTVAVIQFALTIVLLFNRRKWEQIQLVQTKNQSNNLKCTTTHSFLRILMLFIFSGFDVSMNLWMSTYLQQSLNIEPEIAGLLIASYYASVMAGRFFIGIIADKLVLKKVTKYGLLVAIFGLIIMSQTTHILVLFLAIILIGVGMCSVYPFTLFENHLLFDKEKAQFITSYQIAFTLLGSLIFSFIVGLYITYKSINSYQIIQLVILISVLLIKLGVDRMSEANND